MVFRQFWHGFSPSSFVLRQAQDEEAQDEEAQDEEARDEGVWSAGRSFKNAGLIASLRAARG